MQKSHILFIDDDPKISKPLQLALERNHFIVIFAQTGEEALEIVDIQQLDFILLNTKLSGMNGFEIFEKLKSHPVVSETPVMFLTENHDSNENVQGLEMGAVDCVTKPFKLTEVILRIQMRLKEEQSRQKLTPVEFFAGEAQEKEMAKRTGIFKFYNSHTRQEVGEIYVEGGMAVYATSKDAIKEDAFLNLASMQNTSFIFKPTFDVPKKSFKTKITTLILEASKLNDEIVRNKGANADDDEKKRGLIVDRDIIPRILMGQTLKRNGFVSRVTSPDELQKEWFETFHPDILIIDHADVEQILDKLQPSTLSPPIPVVVYSAKENIHEYSRVKEIGDHPIKNFIAKGESDNNIMEIIYQILEGKM